MNQRLDSQKKQARPAQLQVSQRPPIAISYSILQAGQQFCQQIWISLMKVLTKCNCRKQLLTAVGALYQLVDEGESMRAGETLRYVITDYYRKNARKRTVPIELANEMTSYDVKRYTELLALVCNSVTEPFGWTIDTKIVTQ